jgi:hypothetical protein
MKRPQILLVLGALAGCTLAFPLVQRESATGVDAGSSEPATDATSGANRLPDAAAQMDAAPDSASALPSYSDEVLADKPLLYLPLDEALGNSAKNAGSSSAISELMREDGAAPLVTWRSPTFAGGGLGALKWGQFPARFGAKVANGFLLTGTAPFTIEAWVSGLQWSDVEVYPFAYFPVAKTSGCRLLVAGSGIVSFQLLDAARDLGVTFKTTMTNGGNVAVGWTHLIATYDGKNARVFVDGAERPTEITSQIGPVSATGEVLVGTSESLSNGFAFDEIAFYATALTQSRITSHYQAGIRKP